MTTQTHTTTQMNTQTYARIAGLLYLIIILCGIGGEAMMRAPLIGKTATDTLANILAAETSFRVSLLADVLMVLADVGIGALLYFLLAPVDKMLSFLAMAFRLAQAAILGLNLVHLQQAITFAHTSAFNTAQKAALVNTSLQSHAIGYDLGLFCFALNCVFIGILLLKTHNKALKWIGMSVILAALVYFTGSILRLVAPTLAATFAAAYVIPLIAELALCGYLLFRGLPSLNAPAKDTQ